MSKIGTHFFMEAPNAKVAIVGTVCLRAEETYCLESSDVVLHDNLLEFCLEWIHLIKYKEDKDHIEIIGPSVTQCINITENDEFIGDMIRPLKLMEKKVVLIPVNNSTDADQEGTHWSLVVLVPSTEHFYHLDTMGTNKIAHRLSSQLLLTNPQLKHFSGTVRTNGTNCGLYVLLNADIAIAHFLKTDQVDGFHPVKKGAAITMRQEMLLTLRQVSEDQKKKASGAVNAEQ